MFGSLTQLQLPFYTYIYISGLPSLGVWQKGDFSGLRLIFFSSGMSQGFGWAIDHIYWISSKDINDRVLSWSNGEKIQTRIDRYWKREWNKTPCHSPNAPIWWLLLNTHMVHAVPQLKWCTTVNMLSQLCTLPEENWQNAERFQPDGQIAQQCPTLKYLQTLCACAALEQVTYVP